MRIRALRSKRGWRQRDLADKSGIHDVTISRIESGQGDVTLATLTKLAAALDVPLATLFADDDASNAPTATGELDLSAQLAAIRARLDDIERRQGGG